jgi:hypothetical protein
MARTRGGQFSLWGDFPPSPDSSNGAARGPREPSYKNARWLIATFTTTPSAVEALIPEALSPGARTEAAVVFADFPWFSMDGVNRPYNELMVMVRASFRGTEGWSVPYIYCGARNGDFTEGTDTGVSMGREGMGFPKKLANISIGMDGFDWTGTAARRGTVLADLRGRFDMLVEPDELSLATSGPALLVREVLKGDFSGFLAREVWAHHMHYLRRPHLLRRGEASLKLAGILHDPLDLLEIVSMGPAYEIVLDIGREGDSSSERLADLLEPVAV